MPLTGRCLTPWRLLVTPGVYEIGRDNTYGWRRYGRDNMTTNSMTTKKCPRRGGWRGQTKHIQFRDMFQKEALPVQLEKRHSLHVGKRFIGRL